MTGILFDPYMRAVDANGDTLSGAKWYFTASGTTTSQPAHTTSALATAHTNPVVADAGGLFEEIYLDNSLNWRARLYTTGQTVNVDTPLVDVDPILEKITGTRAAIQALAASNDQIVFLTEAGREGTFVFDNSDLSTEVTLDTAEGVYLAPDSDATGASGAWIRAEASRLDASWFGATGDAVTDDTTAIQNAVTVAAGAPVYFRTGTFVVTSTLTSAAAATFGAFAPGIKLVGEGIAKTYFDNRVASGPMIDIDSLNHGGSYEASMGSYLGSFTIITTTSPASSDGIRVLNGYEVVMEHLYIKGLTGNGIELRNGLYADDGWNMVSILSTWIDSVGGWGVKADGSSGRNEGSYTYLRHVFFQTCGTSNAAATPPSGGMIWKGQILTMESCAFANGVENVGLFIKGESGLAQTASLRSVTFENCVKRGLYVTGVSVFRGTNLQFYNNDSFVATTQCEFAGPSFTVRNVEIDGATVRATSGNSALTAFKISGANALLDTCRVKNVVWENFDFSGQTRFSGWQFDPVVNNCGLYVPSTVEIYFRPKSTDGEGNAAPLRLAGPNNSGGVGVASTSGEWVSHQIASGGIFLSPTWLPLVAGTRYYIYLYDNDGVAALEPSTTVPVLDASTGYMIKTGDTTRFFCGSVVAGGSNGTVTTSATGWLNPVQMPASQIGVPGYMWMDATADLRVKVFGPPTSDTDGTVVGTQT